MLAAVIAEAVAIVLLGVLVLGLLRSHALILKALHELGAGLELEREAGTGVTTATTGGTPGPVPVELETGVVQATRKDSATAHDIIGTDLDRVEQQVVVTAAGSRTLLAFLTSGCSVCQTFWDEFQGPVDVPGDGDLRIIAKGPAEESSSSLRSLAGDRDVIQSSGAWVDYDIPGSPYFVYVEGGVVTGEGSATTWGQVRDLMAQGVADNAEARAAAGRTGPGLLAGADVGPGERDSLPRMDAELLAAGIGPGNPSLYQSPDAEHDASEAQPDADATPGPHPQHDHRHGQHDHEPSQHDHRHDHHGH
ncbi:hypothetical protein BJ986_001382 [Phycicoccus badiiscoriae]|uniref:Thioredoxin domain-containing protein n=1 Tax=Pedococcus badiiscoriae TaxID=642776 RepID=A0A852WL19_9MICO|nr:hypothetical protein [Pedococcus badiiscoriae]NYG06895.1 hypothetical protein [Pedococcus badiiscoriae]